MRQAYSAPVASAPSITATSTSTSLSASEPDDDASLRARPAAAGATAGGAPESKAWLTWARPSADRAESTHAPPEAPAGNVTDARNDPSALVATVCSVDLLTGVVSSSTTVMFGGYARPATSTVSPGPAAVGCIDRVAAWPDWAATAIGSATSIAKAITSTVGVSGRKLDRMDRA
jgi:hypothetical protein